MRRSEAQADKAEVEARLAKERKTPEQLNKTRKQGGQTKYTKAAALRVCAVMANGGSMREAAQAEGVDPSTILNWKRLYPEFAQQYARARESGFTLLAERLLELPHEAHMAAQDPVTGKQRIEACRFEADTIKWQLCKMLPKVYGDKQQVEMSGPDGSPLVPSISAAELAAAVAATNASFERIRKQMAGDEDKDA